MRCFAVSSLIALLMMVGGIGERAMAGELKFSGYGNAHYMDMTGNPLFVGQRDLNKSFTQLREFSLFIDAGISDELLASVEIEAGDNGSQFTANYAYLQYNHSDMVYARLGKILVPFLSYNENKPNFKQHLMSQPFTAWMLAPVNGVPFEFHGFGWSDVGVMGSLTREMGNGLINFKAAVINGLGSDTNVFDANTSQLSGGPTIRPRDGFIQNEEVNELRDNNDNKAVVLKLTYSSILYPFQVGYSYYNGAWSPTGDKDLTMHGVHAEWRRDDWTLKGEWVTADVEQTAGIDIVGNMMAAAINKSTGDYDARAWYIEGTRIIRRWEDDRWLRAVIRYDEVDTNDEATFTAFDRDRITYGLEWQFAANARLRYEFQDHTIDDFDKAPAPFRNAGGEEDPQMHMASVIFWF